MRGIFKRCWFAVGVVALMSEAPALRAQEPWQSDWLKFIDQLAPYLQRGASIAEGGPAFEGKVVTWDGPVDTVGGTAAAPYYRMAMAKKAVLLSNGTSTDNFSLVLSPLAANIPAWGSVTAGSNIKFKTTLQSNALFSVVALLVGVGVNAGQVIVVISTNDAELLSASSTPSISSVVNGASFQPGMVPDSWVMITGTGLSSVTDSWDKSIVNGKLPTSLDGVSVSIGGKPAYVQYISANQINVQAPDVGLGPMAVTVTNSNGASAAVTATSQQFGPAFFLWGGKYAAATHVDFSPASKAGLFAGVTTVPAKPGEVVVLWGTGFGPANPAVPAGIEVPADRLYPTANPVTVTVGSIGAQVPSAVMSPGYAGLYQIAIQIPSSTPDGDIPIKASVGGSTSPDNVFITVQH